MLRVLCRSEGCTDEDRYALAAAELARGTHDTRPAARAGDESLRLLGGLLDRGVDVGAHLRKDKSLELDHLYYVGFHFSEEGHPLGEELLKLVADKGGRAKIGKMARSKLALGRRASCHLARDTRPPPPSRRRGGAGCCRQGVDDPCRSPPRLRGGQE